MSLNLDKVMIDLSKIEVLNLSSDTNCVIQFASGKLERYTFKDEEGLDLLYCAFVNWHSRERASSLYIMWNDELDWGER